MTYAQYCRLRVPVTAGARAVIRAAHGLLSPAGRAPGARAHRHTWLRAILREHADARALARAFHL